MNQTNQMEEGYPEGYFDQIVASSSEEVDDLELMEDSEVVVVEDKENEE